MALEEEEPWARYGSVDYNTAILSFSAFLQSEANTLSNNDR